MKKITTRLLLLFFILSPFVVSAQLYFNPSKILPERFRKSAPGDTMPNETGFIDKVKKEAAFKPTVQVGALMHGYLELAQPGVPAGDVHEDKWQRNFTLYRARILVGAALSPKGNFFLETELPSTIGNGGAGKPKNFEVSQLLLDCQYEHNFANAFSLIVGKLLVSNNRNGLQGAASLMANDFTHYQYSYNMFETSPLMGNFGRDIGVNSRGFLAKDRLEYRLGVFTGRRFDAYSPYRIVGRLAFNFLDPEKDLYYAGTKLGKGKTLALATGIDAQTNYMNFNVDGFLDVPAGPGSLTVNTAFAYQDGGTGAGGGYSFAKLIPKQTVQFLEVGYYLPSIKIQPWIKYENQIINEDAEFYGLPSSSNEVDNQNKLNSNIRLGAGLNYFFNEYNTNVRLSYTEAFYGRRKLNSTDVEMKGLGQVWLQVQVFFF